MLGVPSHTIFTIFSCTYCIPVLALARIVSFLHKIPTTWTYHPPRLTPGSPAATKTSNYSGTADVGSAVSVLLYHDPLFLLYSSLARVIRILQKLLQQGYTICHGWQLSSSVPIVGFRFWLTIACRSTTVLQNPLNHGMVAISDTCIRMCFCRAVTIFV